MYGHAQPCVCVSMYLFAALSVFIVARFCFSFASCCCPFLARLSVMRYLCFMYLPQHPPPPSRPKCSLTPHIFVYDNILLWLFARRCSHVQLPPLSLCLSSSPPLCVGVCVWGCLTVMDGHILILTRKGSNSACPAPRPVQTYVMLILTQEGKPH